MTQLTSSLPDKAKVLIIGVSHTREAWTVLDEKNGGKEVTVKMAMHRLMRMELPPGPAHDKVEALAAGVRAAKRCLKAIGAEGEIFASCSPIGTLVTKPEESTRHRSHLYLIQPWPRSCWPSS